MHGKNHAHDVNQVQRNPGDTQKTITFFQKTQIFPTVSSYRDANDKSRSLRFAVWIQVSGETNMGTEKVSKVPDREAVLRIISGFRLMDDEFMTECFRDNKPA